MGEEAWHEARLIPTSGINGADEQERRATSALLAVMSAVREFGRALTQPLGAPAGAVEAYIEVPFTYGDQKAIPDGLLRVSRGQRTWTALVEVKTGTRTLEATQLESYLDVARENGFDAVLTISNEIPPAAGLHPTKVDRRRLRKVALHHYSWSQVLAEAVMQREHRGVADADQSWILGELIRYLEHPRSGALEFDDMGPSWVTVRDCVAAGTLRTSDRGGAEVGARFDALLRYASLSLGRQLGTEVVPALSRKEVNDPSLRTQQLVTTLAASGQLSGSIRIPGAIAPMTIVVDLRASTVTCQVEIDAPRDGRETTKVNWLIRQLRNAPDTVRVEAFTFHGRGSSAAELLRDLRVNPATLTDPKRELRSFRVAWSRPVGNKRGRGRGSFIDSVLEAIDGFYVEVVQNLKAWTPNPPRLREAPEPPPIPPVLVSTALSSQDGADTDPVPPNAGAAPVPSAVTSPSGVVDGGGD